MEKLQELALSFEKCSIESRKQPYFLLKERYKQLEALKSLLQHNALDLAQAIAQDFSHRSQEETLLLEIFPAIQTINYCLKHLKKWTKARKRQVSWIFKPASASIFPQPLGKIGIMVPWNYPLILACRPLTYALAAGNSAMIKFSELSPCLGSCLQQLIEKSPLASRVQIVNGDINIAKKFAALPFDHLLFTGSTTTGKAIMEAASKNLTPLTLELGGKSPAILSTTVNKAYLNRLFIGKLRNAGQTCIAPDYLLIPEGWEQQIEMAFGDFLQKHYPQLESNNDYSAIISQTHYEHLQYLLDDARKKGARIVSFGNQREDSRKLPLYLIFNPDVSMDLMQEEIFGPLLPIVTYKSFQEALEYIIAKPKPLVIYYFGENSEEKEQLTMQTVSGALTINDTLTHIAIDDLPFGGVGESGMGRYHGQEGFDNFSQLKPIFKQRRFAPITWFYPPYGKLLKLLLRWQAGIHLRRRND